MTTAQFNHRIVAYAIAVAVVALFVAGRRQGLTGFAATTSSVLLGTVAFQIVIGIWTLIEVVPIPLAALHQFGAVALLTAGIVHVFSLRCYEGSSR